MHKITKIILLILVIIVVYLALFFLATKGIIRLNVVPNTRTLYTGYVNIEPISITEIKTELEKLGCHANNYKSGNDGSVNFCLYTEKENGIEVYPRGVCMGRCSFLITQNKLSTMKDISGPPNSDKFKEEVRQDAQDIGNIIKIKENSWEITKTEYPFTAVY